MTKPDKIDLFLQLILDICIFGTLKNPFTWPRKQARKLQATLESRHPKLCPATDSLADGGEV